MTLQEKGLFKLKSIFTSFEIKHLELVVHWFGVLCFESLNNVLKMKKLFVSERF